MILEAITAALWPFVLLVIAAVCMWHLGDDLFWSPMPVLGTLANWASCMCAALALIYTAYIAWAVVAWLYLTL